jgi:hypothetical protein
MKTFGEPTATTGDPQISVDGGEEPTRAKFSGLYAKAAPEEQLALRV